jgi:hypothetical protein
MRAPDALDLAFLQRAQQLRLEVQRQLPDLVQEQRPAVGQLEAADLPRHRPGEGALLVSEEIALDEGRGDGRAVHLHQHRLLAAAARMEGAGDQLLSGAGLARQEHGGIGRGHLVDAPEDAPEGRRHAHRLVRSHRRLHLVLEVLGQVLQALALGFGPPPFLDVPQDDREERGARYVGVRQGRLDRELLAVGADRGEALGQPDRRSSPGALARIALEHGPEPIRNERPERRAHRLRRREPEHALGGRVEQRDAAGPIDGNDGVHGGLEDAGEPVLALLELHPQLLDGEVRPYPGQELVELEGLGHVVDGAGFESPDLVDRVRQGCHEDDRDVAGRRVLLEPLARREAVEVGHEDVEQDQVGTGMRGALDSTLAILGDQDLEAGLAEEIEENPEVGGGVVHDENDGPTVPVLAHGASRLSSRNWQSFFTWNPSASARSSPAKRR